MRVCERGSTSLGTRELVAEAGIQSDTHQLVEADLAAAVGIELGEDAVDEFERAHEAKMLPHRRVELHMIDEQPAVGVLIKELDEVDDIRAGVGEQLLNLRLDAQHRVGVDAEDHALHAGRLRRALGVVRMDEAGDNALGRHVRHGAPLARGDELLVRDTARVVRIEHVEDLARDEAVAGVITCSLELVHVDGARPIRVILGEDILEGDVAVLFHRIVERPKEELIDAQTAASIDIGAVKPFANIVYTGLGAQCRRLHRIEFIKVQGLVSIGVSVCEEARALIGFIEYCGACTVLLLRRDALLIKVIFQVDFLHLVADPIRPGLHGRCRSLVFRRTTRASANVDRPK